MEIQYIQGGLSLWLSQLERHGMLETHDINPSRFGENMLTAWVWGIGVS